VSDTDNSASSFVCRALGAYGTSIFTEMTALADSAGAVNLSQGFPDFDGPPEIRGLAARAVERGPNQYAPAIGIRALREAVAAKMERFYGVAVDPDLEVTVTAGATEGLAATLLGIVNPGDEVVLIEPSYDLYAPMVARAGGTPVYVQLDDDLGLPRAALAAAFGARTRAIIVNNPQNPCAKVYSREDLEWMAMLCADHGAVAIGDEVYEHLVYDGREHATLLSVAGLRDRAVVVSSTAKTFSMTGWKVGYTVACPALTEAVRMAHQFLTYCTPGPFQEAMAVAVSSDDTYYRGLLSGYAARRSRLCDALDRMGLAVRRPEGTYYATVDIGALGFEDDLAFCRFLAHDVGVAAIPSSFFYRDRARGRNLVRFCFCKKDETLDEAISRLWRWRRGA